MSAAIITPGGRYLGRRPDSPDARDRRYRVEHSRDMAHQFPVRFSLRSTLPACWDQGKLGSCGAQAGDALMCQLYPAVGGFSRLQIYYNVRCMEGNFDQDSGVETRDVLAALLLSGAAPEADWPYDVARFRDPPGAKAIKDAEQYVLRTYSRLISEREYLSCITSGFGFLLGFECMESIDSDELAKTGVMASPGPNEQGVGGHDVFVVGYDLNFRSSDVFRRSGIDPSRVSNEALEIRNSWSPQWGDSGYFWMPMPYAINPSTGGDAWTGRK